MIIFIALSHELHQSTLERLVKKGKGIR